MVVGVRTWEGGGGGEPAGGRTSVRNRRELTIGEGKVDRQKKRGKQQSTPPPLTQLFIVCRGRKGRELFFV